MATEGVRVRGADEVARTLRKLAKDIERMGPTAAEGAELVQRSAQGYARVLTGRMRGSIQVNSTSEGASVTAGEGIASPYPAVQEFGSARRGISPNRYMRQAMESQEPRVADLFQDEVSKMADRVKGA